MMRRVTLNNEEFDKFIKKTDFNLYRYMLYYDGNQEEIVRIFLSNFLSSESDDPYVCIYGDDKRGCIVLEKVYLVTLSKENEYDKFSILPDEIVKDLEVFTSRLNPKELSVEDINDIIKKVRFHSENGKNLRFAKEVYFEIINFFKDEIMSDWGNKYRVYFANDIDCEFPAGIVGRGNLSVDIHRIVLKGENLEKSLRRYLQGDLERFFLDYINNVTSDELDFEKLNISEKNNILDNTYALLQIWLNDNGKFLLNKTKDEFQIILENCKSKKSEILVILNKLDIEVLFDATNQKFFYAFLYRFIIFYFQHKMIRDSIKIYNQFIENKNTQTVAFLEELVLTHQGEKVIDFCLHIDKQKVKIYTMKYFAKHYDLDKSVSDIKQRESDLHELWDLLLKTKNDRNGLREKDEKIPDELPTPCINLSFLTHGENGQYFDQKFLQFLAR